MSGPPIYTWNGRPAANSVPVGTSIRVKDVNVFPGVEQVSDGSNWVPRFSHSIAGSVALVGDSITAQCYAQSPSVFNPSGITANTKMDSRSWLAWAMALSGNALTPVYVGGVSGERSDQILTRVQTALSFAPRFLIELMGTNDVSQLGATDPTGTENIIIANRTTAWIAARAAGARVLALSITPVRSDTTFNATQQAIILRVNRRLRELARSFDNVIYVDIHSALVDPTSASGFALTANLFDPLHPNTRGAFIIGQTLWNCMSKLVPPYTGLLSTRCYAECAVRVTSCVNLRSMYMSAEYNNFSGSAASPPYGGLILSGFTGDAGIPDGSYDLVLRTPVTQFPVDATALTQMRVNVLAAFGAAGGGGTFDVYRVSLCKE